MGGKGHPPSSSESEDWGEESWIVDCPCGVNYDDGDEMVECDECGVWVHTACCRVPKELPTFGCDKCKIKKKLKEETEVAQLLAELPGKTVSLDERYHEKTEAYNGHPISSQITVEERAHVQGIAGGDPSFFVGVSKVFGRQLWKYTGYVPKYLKVDDRELPEPREDVAEFLRDLPVFEVPMSLDDGRTLAPILLENGHSTPTLSEMEECKEEVSKEDPQVPQEALKDKQGKNHQVKKGDGKHSKHRHKPKVKEEKSHHHGKRARDEGGQKEHTSKKKLRDNGDHGKPEDGHCKKVEALTPQDAGLLSKSPQSSPKNPKAMKKLAVQEFMDGDMILCSRCGKVEAVFVRAVLIAGDSAEGKSDLLCQECERLGDTSPVTPPLGPGSVKQEPSALVVPSVLNMATTLELRLVSKRELDYCEAGVKNVRFRDEGNHSCTDGDSQANSPRPGKERSCNYSTADMLKVEAELKTFLRNSGIQESSKDVEESQLSAKLEPRLSTVQVPDVEIESGRVVEEPLAARSAEARKARGYSTKEAADLSRDGEFVFVTATATEAEARTPLDCIVDGLGEKQPVFVEGCAPWSSLEKSSNVPGTELERRDIDVSAVAVSQGRISPSMASETLEDKTSKVPAHNTSEELKGQGSARTAGHLPASVRGKMLGERPNHQLPRSSSGVLSQHQNPFLSGLSLTQLSVETPRTGQASVSPSMKGSCAEDSLVVKQHGQSQLESISPIQQFGKHLQQGRILSQTQVSHKSPIGLPEIASPSQPSSSAQRLELEQQLRSPQPQGVSVSHPETEDMKPMSPAQVTPTQVFCRQPRQLNGIGHVYSSRPKNASSNHITVNSSGTNPPSQAQNPVMSNTKVSISSLKSPSSGTSSSSPTSPLVTTPLSKPQLVSVKVPGSPPPQKSLSGSSTPKASNIISFSTSKLSASATPITSSGKQTGTLQPSKSVPSLPTSPLSSKSGSILKQTPRSSSLPATKTVDGSSSVGKFMSVTPSRGANPSGPSSGSLMKDNVKNLSHSTSKISIAGKTMPQPPVTKPTSAKPAHSHASMKGPSGTSVSKQHSGPVSATAKSSTLPSTTKSTAAHHGTAGISHKEEKTSMPSAPPVPKAMSSMPPPPPQVLRKRSPPTVLASFSAATTLKDEEIALRLHQELNSSPRVSRAPRVRQAGASLQPMSSPSLSSAKGSSISATSGGSSHKDNHPYAVGSKKKDQRRPS